MTTKCGAEKVRFAWRKTQGKSTDTWQEWLRERSSVLLYTYIACLVCMILTVNSFYYHIQHQQPGSFTGNVVFSVR
jgi:hypothetical protein